MNGFILTKQSYDYFCGLIMPFLFKKHISIFFISLWVITQVLQVGHESSHHIFSHGHKNHILCSHHHHNEVKLPDTTTDRVASHEECVICDYEWFNLLESLSDYKIHSYTPDVIPSKLGTISAAITENWTISPILQRGPPLIA